MPITPPCKGGEQEPLQYSLVKIKTISQKEAHGHVGSDDRPGTRPQVQQIRNPAFREDFAQEISSFHFITSRLPARQSGYEPDQVMSDPECLCGYSWYCRADYLSLIAFGSRLRIRAWGKCLVSGVMIDRKSLWACWITSELIQDPEPRGSGIFQVPMRERWV